MCRWKLPTKQKQVIQTLLPIFKWNISENYSIKKKMIAGFTKKESEGFDRRSRSTNAIREKGIAESAHLFLILANPYWEWNKLKNSTTRVSVWKSIRHKVGCKRIKMLALASWFGQHQTGLEFEPTKSSYWTRVEHWKTQPNNLWADSNIYFLF